MKKFTSLMFMLLCTVTAWAGVTDLPKITTDLDNPIYYTISNTRSASGGLIYYTADGIKDNNPTAITDAYKFFFTGTSMSDLRIHNAAAGELLFAGTEAWTNNGVSCAIAVTPHESNAGLSIGFSGTFLNEKNDGDGYTTWGANDEGSIFVIDLCEDVVMPEEDKFYTIEAPLFHAVSGVRKGLLVREDGSLGWNTIDLKNKNCFWQVERDAVNGYAIKNVGTGKYLNGTDMNDAANYASIRYIGLGQFNIVVNGVVVHAEGHTDGQGTSGNIVTYGGKANSASGWRFVERIDPEKVAEVSVVYSFVYGGKVRYTQEAAMLTGEEYPALTVALPWGVSAVSPKGIIQPEDATEGVVAKNIELTVSLPFECAASYKDIEKWYFLKFHANDPRYLYYDGTENVLDGTKKTYNAADVSAYQWAFVGNPFDGISVVNAKAGEGKYLNAAADGAAIGTAAHLFKLTKGAGDENGFYMQATNSDKTDRFNLQGGKVVYWSGADAGSTFMVEDLDLVVDKFKAGVVPGLGYVGGYAVDKADEIEAITSFNEMIKFQNENAVIEFSANKYYRIQNVFRKTFISVEDSSRVLMSEDHASVNQLWQVENGSKAGDYFIKNPNVGYMQAVDTDNNKLVSEGGAELTIASYGVATGQFAIKSGSNMLAGINASQLGLWWNGTIDSDMAYRFIEVDGLEISVEGFAATYLPFAVEVDGDAKVYAVTEVTNEEAVLAEKADVPAEQGAVITGNGTVKLNIIDAAASDWTGNKLAGTLVDTDLTTVAYALSGEGFAKTELTDGKYALAANQAYLPMGELTADALPLNFTGVPTAIENVETENVEQVVYDLTGRRVEKITEAGIYIVDGKKVLVK